MAISENLSKTNLYRTVQNETLQSWLQWIEAKSTEKLTGDVFGYLFRYKWQDWRKEHVPDLEFSPDIQRHTFGTYHLKTLQYTGAAALETSNSESIIKRHYLDARRPLEDAERFWSFIPNKNRLIYFSTPTQWKNYTSLNKLQPHGIYPTERSYLIILRHVANG